MVLRIRLSPVPWISWLRLQDRGERSFILPLLYTSVTTATAMTPQAAKKRLANEKEWASSNTYSTGPAKTLKECKDRWSMQEVMDELNVSRYTIHRKIKDKLFPKPLMKSGRNLYFKRTDIERWMEDNPAYVKNEYTPKTVPGAIGVAFTEKEQKRIKEASSFLNEEHYQGNISLFIAEATMHYVERIESKYMD